MATQRKRTGIEWVGGVMAMPAYVTGEGGPPYRPEALFWMDMNGMVIGHAVGVPGEVLAQACESLRNTIARPAVGRPHAPDRVRVASPVLAEALRAGMPTLDVVCAPTPELDALFAGMREHGLGGDDPGDDEPEQSYLAPDIGPPAIAALFRATAALFRAQPWKVVPSDSCLFSVSIAQLGLEDAALSVIGQRGESLGLILFASVDDYDAYLDAADAFARGAAPSLPPHFAVSFDRGADLSPALRKEITTHRWEVASADAYPCLVAIDEDFVARPPTAAEVVRTEATARALCEVLREADALRAAWAGGAPVVRTLVVETHAGALEVSLRAPAPGRPPAKTASRATKTKRKTAPKPRKKGG